MMQALQISKAPIIASHSAARALCNHSRNLDDEQLLALKKNGGVVQTVAFATYVKSTDTPERLAALDALRKEFGLPPGTPLGGRGGARPRRRARGHRCGARAPQRRRRSAQPRRPRRWPRRRRARAAERGAPRRARQARGRDQRTDTRRSPARRSRTSSITSTTSSRRSASTTSGSRPTSTAAAASTAGTMPARRST